MLTMCPYRGWLCLAALSLAACATAAPPAAYTARILATPNDFWHARGQGFGGGYAGSGFGPATNDKTHALFWADAASTAVDLTPLGFTATDLSAAAGAVQVGHGSGPVTSDAEHALVWSGTAGSAVDLHPNGYQSSRAFGTDGNTQVGEGTPDGDSGKPHALLWNDTAASVVSLHPPNAVASTARDARQNQQVGSASFLSAIPENDPAPRAALWIGTAQSVRYLHPIGFNSSVALAVGVDSIVGYGDGVGIRALLWRGTGDNDLNDIVDLHPTGYYQSYALDVEDDTQIGFGILDPTDLLPHALRWTGSQESVVDLHQFLGELPVDMLASEAHAILPDGTIIGSGTSTDLRTYAVVWTPVPEPVSMAILLPAIGMGAIRRKRPSR